VQKEGESLANYIQAVRDAALILRIVETEAQVVGRIVEGLTPTQRARFVFQAPPTSYAQLEPSVIVDRNINYADAVREIPVPTGPSRAIETRAVTATARRVQKYKNANTGNILMCFRCGKPGHIQRYRRAKFNSRGRNFRTPGKQP
jgi:hypothetical protein